MPFCPGLIIPDVWQPDVALVVEMEAPGMLRLRIVQTDEPTAHISISTESLRVLMATFDADVQRGVPGVRPAGPACPLCDQSVPKG